MKRQLRMSIMVLMMRIRVWSRKVGRLIKRIGIEIYVGIGVVRYHDASHWRYMWREVGGSLPSL